MNDTIKMVNTLSEYLTDKEVGLLIKQAGLQQKLQDEILMGINDAFYGKLAKLAQKVGVESQQRMMEMFEEDYSEVEILIEVIKNNLSMIEKMQDLEGYEEYEILATEVYGKYDIGYKDVQDATAKMRKLLEDEEVAKKVLKELD